MKDTTNLSESNCFGYGGFSERWKYDAFVKRKNWYRRNRFKLILVSAAFVSAVAVGVFFIIK